MPIDDRRIRIVDAAQRCFAAGGYHATTIADIEAAAGYTPRTGGIYRFFPSKRALLEAVIDRSLADNEQQILSVAPPAEPVDPAALLETVARRGLRRLGDGGEILRIVHRDLDEFPELQARVRAELIDRTFADFADRLRVAVDAGAIPPIDVEAVAVIAIGAVVDFATKQHLIGHRSLGLDDDRFVATWVSMMLATLSLDA